MNLPNKLTVFRIILVPILLILLMLPLPAAAVQISAAAVFILASLTDLIDGKIARKYSLITDFGKFMDPLADKFIVFAALHRGTRRNRCCGKLARQGQDHHTDGLHFRDLP